MTGAFTPGARAAVLASNMGLCVGGCGMPAVEVHHRAPRGMGGTSRAEVGAPHNGLPVCRVLHDWIEGHYAASVLLGWKTQAPDPGAPFWAPVFGVWRAWVEDDGVWLVESVGVTGRARLAVAAVFAHTPGGFAAAARAAEAVS